jgi:hypothetical protein
MEKQTQNVITHLLNFNTICEAVDFVHTEHARIKSKMLAYGVKFYDDEPPLSQGVEGIQQFKNDDEVLDIRFYEEINYIRIGLTKHWIYNMFEPDRFNKIKKSVQAIVDIYKLDRRKNSCVLNDA